MYNLSSLLQIPGEDGRPILTPLVQEAKKNQQYQLVEIIERYVRKKCWHTVVIRKFIRILTHCWVLFRLRKKMRKFAEPMLPNKLWKSPVCDQLPPSLPASGHVTEVRVLHQSNARLLLECRRTNRLRHFWRRHRSSQSKRSNVLNNQGTFQKKIKAQLVLFCNFV